MEEYLRTYCEIDLKAIRENYINIKKKTGDKAMTMAVIKADGYGHGAVPIAKEIEHLDYVYGYADYFGVATIDEGVELRKAGLKQPILLLGYNSPSLYYKNLEYGVDQTIYCYDTAKAMSEAAVKSGKTARIHIALDTGMTRIGLSPDEKGLAIVEQIANLPNIKIEGLFTHLSCADMTDKTYTESQMKRYDYFVELLDQAGIEIPVKHICNSAAIMEYDDHRYDMARAGIILYGMYPSDEVDFSNLELIPAMSWYSHVVNIMEPEMERGVSYGATYVVDHPCRLATISVGYADGYARSLSNKGWVLIHGKKAPIVGRVCMDQFMVDISGIPGAMEGDKVTLLGADGQERITAEELGELSGRFNYEFVCTLGKRIPRVYRRNGEITEVKDYFENF